MLGTAVLVPPHEEMAGGERQCQDAAIECVSSLLQFSHRATLSAMPVHGGTLVEG